MVTTRFRENFHLFTFFRLAAAASRANAHLRQFRLFPFSDKVATLQNDNLMNQRMELRRSQTHIPFFLKQSLHCLINCSCCESPRKEKHTQFKKKMNIVSIFSNCRIVAVKPDLIAQQNSWIVVQEMTYKQSCHTSTITELLNC